MSLSSCRSLPSAPLPRAVAMVPGDTTTDEDGRDPRLAVRRRNAAAAAGPGAAVDLALPSGESRDSPRLAPPAAAPSLSLPLLLAWLCGLSVCPPPKSSCTSLLSDVTSVSRPSTSDWARDDREGAGGSVLSVATAHRDGSGDCRCCCNAVPMLLLSDVTAVGEDGATTG